LGFWGYLGDTAPKRGEENVRTDMYHHAKFYADRYHRAEIAVTVQKLTSTLILDKTHTNVAFVDNIAGALFHGYF